MSTNNHVLEVMGSSFKQRVEQFKAILSTEKVDCKAVAGLCFDGIPDKAGIRSCCWKILLNYLPPQRGEWEDFLKKKRDLYQQYIDEIVIHPSAADETEEHVDHPLNTSPSSNWHTFFKDNEVLLQIDRDVRRLCPDISFFQHATEYPAPYVSGTAKPSETLRKRVERAILDSSVIGTNRSGLKNASTKKSTNDEYLILPEGQEAHWEVVERMLFIYAKLNPGLGYVQGMNEIIGVLYYVFATDPNSEWQVHAEADSFYCFTLLMGEIRDNFIKTLDDSACGIGTMMTKLLETLKVQDHELWEDLEKKHLKPQFYAFRWLTLLLSQEFHLPDVIRLWDSLFADSNRFDFLIFTCCAMMVLMRDQILSGDFSKTIKLLQNFPADEIDMASIISKARELKNPPMSSHPITGKSQSKRGYTLKQRLSQLRS